MSAPPGCSASAPRRSLFAAATVKPDAKSALLVVDVQNCFVTGGTLPVKDGEQVVPIINKLSSAFENVIVTQDWHTPGHISFASTHAGKKPFETTKLSYGTQCALARPLRPGLGGRGASQGPDIAEGAAHHQEGLPPKHRQLLGVHGGRRQDLDRPGRVPEGARRRHRLRLWPGDRFLRRLDRARREEGRLQGLRHRGRIARHRPQRLAQSGVGQDEQGRRQADPARATSSPPDAAR